MTTSFIAKRTELCYKHQYNLQLSQHTMHTVTESPDFNNSLDTVISDGITICILWDEFTLEVPIGITANAFQWGPLISFPLSKTQ